jgi:D-alanyl-D-alanine carboxypeptidase (penicillin-binding protein 5/6)
MSGYDWFWSETRGAARRGAILALICAALAVATGSRVVRAEAFQSQAPFAILYDMQTGSVLYEKEADKPFAPASLVKLMVAAVVFQEISAGRLTLESEMTVSVNAWRKGGAPAGNLAMFLTPGQRPKISELLTGLLVASGNDAALTLAEGISGTEASFVQLMNQRAAEIGLKSSQFGNATGLTDPAQHMTMRDVLILSAYIIRTFPDLYRFCAVREFTWGRTRRQNHNPLLAGDLNADGLMDANSPESGYAIAGSAVVNGQRMIIVLGGMKTDGDRGTEARKLIEWGTRNFDARTLFASGFEIDSARVFGGTSLTVGMKLHQEVRTLVPRGDPAKVTASIVYRAPLIAPVHEGDEIGRLTVKRGEIKVFDVPLYAAESVEIGSLTQRARDAAWELVAKQVKFGWNALLGRNQL